MSKRSESGWRGMLTQDKAFDYGSLVVAVVVVFLLGVFLRQVYLLASASTHVSATALTPSELNAESLNWVEWSTGGDWPASKEGDEGSSEESSESSEKGCPATGTCA